MRYSFLLVYLLVIGSQIGINYHANELGTVSYHVEALGIVSSNLVMGWDLAKRVDLGAWKSFWQDSTTVAPTCIWSGVLKLDPIHIGSDLC